jgi:hypothetical protein
VTFTCAATATSIVCIWSLVAGGVCIISVAWFASEHVRCITVHTRVYTNRVQPRRCHNAGHSMQAAVLKCFLLKLACGCVISLTAGIVVSTEDLKHQALRLTGSVGSSLQCCCLTTSDHCCGLYTSTLVQWVSSASAVHQQCISSASAVHQQCISNAPAAHQQCISSTSPLLSETPRLLHAVPHCECHRPSQSALLQWIRASGVQLHCDLEQRHCWKWACCQCTWLHCLG